jgi:hypothetical protein
VALAQDCQKVRPHTVELLQDFPRDRTTCALQPVKGDALPLLHVFPELKRHGTLPLHFPALFERPVAYTLTKDRQCRCVPARAGMGRESRTMRIIDSSFGVRGRMSDLRAEESKRPGGAAKRASG